MSGDPHLPTPEEILVTHEEIEDAYDMKYTGTKVVAPKLKLRRILQDTDEYEGVYMCAAFLLRKLITRHIFEDGNKRTAWTTVREYLSAHGETPADHGPSAKQVMYRVRRYDVDEIAVWLDTGKIDEDRLTP